MMESLPGGRAFVQRILVYTGAYSLLAVLVITLYLSGLLRMSAEQWRGFSAIVAVVFALIFPAMTLSHRRIFQRIWRCLDRHATGEVGDDELRSGFAAISDFPRYWFAWGLVWWAIGGVAVGGCLWLRYPELGALPPLIIFTGTISGAFITDIYYYLTIKRVLARTRVALAAEIGEPEARRALIRGVSLRTKLLASMTSVILVTVIFAALLAQMHTERGLERYSLRGKQRSLDVLVKADGFSFEDASAWASSVWTEGSLVLLDASGERVLAGPADALGEAELAEIRRLGIESQDGAGSSPAASFAWRRLPGDERVLVAVTPLDVLSDEAGIGWAFAALLIFSTLVAVGVAYLLAQDVGEATELLRREAARVAGGDLTRGEILESEDEMGELAHSFERMASSLRGTVARVAGAADRMQSAAGDIASASQSVAQVTASQVRGIAQATTSMGEIDDRVRGIAGSAANLNGEIDSATSSIFELEATGSELSDGAAALSSSVEEVASAIEEMARSISQVAENSDSLAGAADEASTSMEQTAAAAKQVDSNASELSRLSSQVVDFAETGRERVQQTIQGMDAIREATDSAREVSTKLVDSTRQIDTVIGVIDTVADETNLLALNAAIIAAQAGEHGRAFAVVASQIKELADRVLSSTKEITQLIHSVQQESGEAQSAMARGSESVQRGVELSGEAGTSLEEITRASQESGTRTGEIVAAVNEQSRAIGHVAELMARVRSGTEQIRQAIWEQGRGTGLVRESSDAMGGVSKQVKRTTEEQARAATGIHQSVQSIRDAVVQINSTLQEQTSACREAVEFLQRVHHGTDSNEESVRQLDQATGVLREKAEELHREIAHFRI
jgi:methyl-accepting chemotaxis protein